MPQASRFRRNQFDASSRAQQQSGLLGQWDADLFPAGWRGDNTAAFVDFLHASFGGRRLMRGENRPGGGNECFDLFAHGGLVPLDR
jgi:hypothetical protein